MHIRPMLGAMAGAIVTVSFLPAQEPAQNAVFHVVTVDVAPSSLAAWRTAWTLQAETARRLGVSSAETGWWAYGADNTMVLVRPKSRDELFPSGMGVRGAIRAVDSAAAAAIGEAFSEVEARAARTEIIVHNPELSYVPEGAVPEQGGAQVWELTVAPGRFADFRTHFGEMMTILKELKYPYPLSYYNVRYGDNRIQVVTFFDTFEHFYGANSLNTLFQANPALAQRAETTYGAFLETVTSMKTTTFRYAKEMSFPPEG